MRIGVDFGGVLTPTTTPPPGGNHLATPPRVGARETLFAWRDAGHVPILVSKAGTELKEMQAGLWLAHHHFYNLFDRVRFCRTQEGKIDICQEEKIDVIIDDTERQLHLLAGIVVCRILFNASTAPDGLIAVRDWSEAARSVDAMSA